VEINGLASRVTPVIGIASFAFGAVFLIFGVAPVVVPGGMPAGFLEFGGRDANVLEAVGGAVIMVSGAFIWKYGSGHRAMTAGGVVLILLLSLFSAASSVNSHFTLTGIDLNIRYGPNDQGYLGPAQQTLPIGSGPNLVVDEGSAFTVSFTISESSVARGDIGVASISASAPDFSFVVTSTHPSLPVTLSPGASTQIQLVLMAPFYSMGQNPNYEGPINLTLTTTGG
jgi:hypothetical protein